MRKRYSVILIADSKFENNFLNFHSAKFHFLPGSRLKNYQELLNGFGIPFKITDINALTPHYLVQKNEIRCSSVIFTCPVKNICSSHLTWLAKYSSDYLSDSLLSQTEAWVSELKPQTRIQIEEFHGTDQVRISYSSEVPSGTTKKFRATNEGFGLSFVLPIIVALLVTKLELIYTISDEMGVRRPRVMIPRWFAWLVAPCFEILGRIFQSEPIITRSRVVMMADNFGYSIEKAKKELMYEPKGIGKTVQSYIRNSLL